MTPLALVRFILAAYPDARVEAWLHHSSVRLGDQPLNLLFNGHCEAVIGEARAIAAGTVRLDHLDVLAVVGEQP